MLYHMDLLPSVEKVLVTKTSQSYIGVTLRLLAEAEEAIGGASMVPASLAGSGGGGGGGGGRGGGRGRAGQPTLLDIRQDIANKLSMLFSQRDTLKDWSGFLHDVVGN
jgi:hypothetical protein